MSAEELTVSWRDGRREQYPSISASQKNETPKPLWHPSVIEDFIDAVLQGRDPIVTGDDALASHQLINAIEISSRDGVAVEVTD